DGRGNLTYDGQFYKTYDAEGRLVKDSSSPTSVLTYGYDAIGRKVVKSINGNLFTYTYAGAEQIEERDKTNVLLNKTVFNNFLLPLVNENSGKQFYYHQNELMSVDAITNSSGRLLESYQYDAFGKLQRYDSSNNPLASSLAGNRFGFTGQEWDSATNSYRFFYRNYSTESGVFNQRDLIEYKDGMGMYQYVGNNPANGVDVLGLEDCETKSSNIIEEKFPLTVSIFGVINGYVDGKYFSGPMESYQKAAKSLSSELSGYSDFQKGLNRLGFETKAVNPNATKGTIKALNAEANALSNGAKAAKGLGFGLGILDLGIKGINAGEAWTNGQSNAQYTEEAQATGDLLLSGLGFTGVGGVFSILDAGVELTTGKGITSHTADLGNWLGEKSVTSGTQIENDAWDYASSKGKGRDWLRAKLRMEERIRQHQQKKIDCPEGGTLLRPRYVWDPITGELRIVWPEDPNEIVGPSGVDDKKWVSINDR
ncbi:MAG: RHS repeat-associated core domain-containing protein, partial [Chitinophagaceae bacterium]